MSCLSPIDYGLPAKFPAWRSNQWEAVNAILDSPSRFVCLCAPTGAGKSIMYIAAALLSGLRTVCLTSTKGLQDQVVRDFESIGTIDIRGMQNYRCDMAGHFGLPAYTRVADAPCLAGANCSLRGGGCEYFDRYRQAQAADIVVTNYQCWMHDPAKRRGSLGSVRPVDMLILDECHSASDALSSFLSVELLRRDCQSLQVTWPMSGYDQEQWQQWAKDWSDRVNDRREDLEAKVKGQDGGRSHTVLHEIRELKDLGRKLDRVAGMQDEWVIEELGREDGTMKGVRFDPLWPRRYAESVLFRGVKKVVLVSATVRPKTAELLGVPGKEMEFIEYPSSFPVDRRPVIHVPTVRMNHRNELDDGMMLWWLRKMDSLIERRLDRKGIIHAVSYRRMRFILDNSRHKDRMLVHGSDNRAEVIERFRRAGPGTVLVSPSVDTGYDFAMDAAEFQIIGKVPFQDTRDAVMKARTREDRDYGMYLTAQTLQQMTGRVTRSETDRGETLICDDNISWVVGKFRHYFNKWWLESFRKSGPMLPEPPPKL